MSDCHSSLPYDLQPKPDADLPPTPRETELLRRIESLEAENAQLRRALAELATCVEDGRFCSEMEMASAIDDARAALKEKKDD